MGIIFNDVENVPEIIVVLWWNEEIVEQIYGSIVNGKWKPNTNCQIKIDNVDLNFTDQKQQKEFKITTQIN